MEASSNQNAAYSGRDRLSDQPDSLLHTILSRLKSRQVVQTSLLSRRWRHLWRSAPSIDIDSREFRFTICRVESDKFEDFVDSLLLHHSTDGLLHTLRLRIEINDQTSPCMPRWIRRALNCAPAVLVIHYGESIRLPPRSSGTRRLTKLCLDQVSLHRDFQEQITTGLPVLEDLRFRNSDLRNLSWIKSDTLKNLTLDCCQTTIYCPLRIAALRLTSLHFCILFYNRACFIVAEAPSLVEASICLVKKPKQKPYHWELGCGPDTCLLLKSDLSKLLSSLFNSNVSSLKLAGFQQMMVDWRRVTVPVPNLDGILQVSRAVEKMMDSGEFTLCPMLQWILEEERDTLPMFGKLRTIMLDNCEAGDNIQVLWSLLHNAPLLEILTLNNCKFSNRCKLGNLSFRSLSSNISNMPPELKLLEIRYNDKNKRQLKHEGTRPIDEVLSMIRRKLPATTMIQATKVPRKTSKLEASFMV